MKEINEYFKNENYECNLLITDKSMDIGLSGLDEYTNELILEFYSFDDESELLDYLERIENSAFTNKLSIFRDDLKGYITSKKCFTIIPA